ncbi:conjugal transfer protein TraG [Jannaschia pagri]|uniref:Conjugal transfer protein TraG n=1 Tax=Jannaschia pagri TaxID=2829797 RepID=A0ABQ4NRC8_9RHOB|nr:MULTISPECIES: type IV secretory system conjugative DNA transfer family protein [unclassified Jannaschia]GIT93135.1 conjugal transfer protein TraG [Jannaschia sp. AI_61]GIT96958.1 conjugal transfer protein TraG [Jannaschia sp. AI_62]
MRWRQKLCFFSAGFGASCVLAASPALAEYVYFNGQLIEQSTLNLWMTVARIGIPVLSGGVGFGLGFLCSPKAKPVRMIAGVGLLGAAGLALVFSNGWLGWGVSMVASAGAFCAALGYWLGKAAQSLFEVPPTFGSASWATSKELSERGLFADDGLRLGGAFNGEDLQTLSYSGDRHLLTVAPTRSGKGATQIVPNLLTYEGSVLVIDPKAENAKITANARINMGQEVYLLDPWDIAGITTADGKLAPSCLNPLDWLMPDDPDVAENAMLLADAFIEHDNKGDSFWVEEAKALLQGVILYVASDPREAEHRHLGRVRELMLLDGDGIDMLFHCMLESPHHVVASTGARSLQKDPKLLANVLAAAQAQTHILDSPRLQETLSRSDFDFAELKRKPMTIYLILPADRLHTFNRFLRLMVQQALVVNARSIDVQPQKPVLFLLDEMAALGKLPMIEEAYGLMAGFGIQLWGIVQDLSQLEKLYDKGWQSFIANSGAIGYFGSRDKKTAEYFSSLCGVTTVWSIATALGRAFSVTSSQQGGSTTNNSSSTSTFTPAQRNLAYPDELMRLSPEKQLLFIEDMNPIQAHKRPWFEDDDLKSRGVDLHAPEADKPFE